MQDNAIVSDKGGLEYYATCLTGSSKLPPSIRKKLKSLARRLGVGYKPETHEWYTLSPLSLAVDGVLRVAQLVSWGAALIESQKSE